MAGKRVAVGIQGVPLLMGNIREAICNYDLHA
jgi:hypothetical protein